MNPLKNTARCGWALVTGASSGLGVAFATDLASRGYDLVLVARREQPMRLLAAKLEQACAIKVEIEAIDLTEPGAAAGLASRTDARGIELDVLVNNAAFAVSGFFLDQDLDRQRSMLQLNILSLTDLTHVFGQRMARRKKGHLLLVASVGAYTPAPLAAAYSAAKAYVLSLGVALQVELAPDVGVTVVSPGLMETEFHEVAGYTMKPSMKRSVLKPEEVARIGLDALFAGTSSVVAGRINKLGAFTSRLLPRSVLARMTYRMSKA